MSQPPQQPWDTPQPPGQHPWNQQGWGQPAGGPSWQQGPAPRTAGGARVALLVLGLVTAALGLLGTFLPNYTYGDDGSYSPLLQRFGDDTVFLLPGLVLVAAAALTALAALLQRGRPGAWLGLLLFGSGLLALGGLSLLMGLLQSAVDDGFATNIAVGGVLALLAGLTAVATAVVGSTALARTR